MYKYEHTVHMSVAITILVTNKKTHVLKLSFLIFLFHSVINTKLKRPRESWQRNLRNGNITGRASEDEPSADEKFPNVRTKADVTGRWAKQGEDMCADASLVADKEQRRVREKQVGIREKGTNAAAA